MFFILGAILWVLFAFWPAYVAKKKGHSFVLFFILSLFFFFFALILAFMVKDKTMTARDRADAKAADETLAEE